MINTSQPGAFSASSPNIFFTCWHGMAWHGMARERNGTERHLNEGQKAPADSLQDLSSLFSLSLYLRLVSPGAVDDGGREPVEQQVPHPEQAAPVGKGGDGGRGGSDTRRWCNQKKECFTVAGETHTYCRGGRE